MNLGIKEKRGELPVAQPTPTKEPEIRYPGFTINDEKVDEFLKAHKVSIGDEITATVKLKVSGVSDQNWGKSLQFDVHSLDVEGDTEGAEEESETEEKAKGKKSNPAIERMMMGEDKS